MISLRSLPRLCVAVGAAKPAAMEQLARAALESGERFIEARLDLLGRPASGPRVVKRLLEAFPRAVVLATCRRRPNGGAFDGSIAEQENILRAAVRAGARLVDVEIETAEEAPEAVERLRETSRVVVSFHDFERTPPLSRALARLRKIDADIHKLAVTARKPSDNVRLLDAADPAAEPPVALMTMGEVGAAGRVLAPSRGGLFTFASPDGAAGTAPGQFSACVMRHVFQAQRRTRETKIYGVIGSPVAHSLSPTIHNLAFRKERLDACYLPFLVEPRLLRDFARLVEALPVDGFSVTIPHKRKVIGLLAGVDRLAERIGAVNTVHRKRGKLWGTNTDVLGVVEPLGRRLRLDKARVLIVGYGGAARAAAFALADRGARVVLTGRNPRRARALAAACGAEWAAFENLDRYDALVQSTPVGMHPDVEGNLFPEKIPAEVVFEMVYNPLETALIRRARQAGLEVVEGVEMFIEQAAAQFEIWTGRAAPRRAMRAAVIEVLRGARSRRR